ncbi:MAG: hypothetical protein JWM11_7173, partial [Planctomycetaceae bacterium]|nr:hypothetical protein [Planctomycetaceae bacterium]
GEQRQGLCVLSGLSGNMLGGGEGVEIVLEDESWKLRGTSQQQELQFDAMLIQIHKVKK